ncbi:pirin family protein [Kineosporia sp. R_H_3]|uniref:pirin family protein n=1 Tax=Kineosporia sp. R_H_3 TaxID=1961848 RepID=UPI000B4C0455|nr:pirin family protein [Kineosporia sp. R_H_3]
MSRLDPDVVGTDAAPAPDGPGTSLLEPREVPLGGPRALLVRRTLPHKQIRTIGAWCFVDHFGPAPVAETGMHVPPHPHIGLQTVTWLYSGEVLHRDGLGSEQVVRPGELNLMTAGRGIAHAEDSVLDGPDGAEGPDGPDGPPVDRATMHGLQLWVALPDGERHQEPHFEHHAGLPTVGLPGATATVVLGALGPADARDAVRSPAATYSPIVGADLVLDAAQAGPGAPGTAVPLDPAFEHGVIAVEGEVRADGVTVPRGALLHLPPGRGTVTLSAVDGRARVFLLGGPPFGERLVMWWNFVGRDHDDIARARADWEVARSAPSDRFAAVVHPVPALPAPALPTTRLLPR